jgi:hypothetical protein
MQTTYDNVEERLAAICKRFDAATVSAVGVYTNRHCSNFRELESRLSSAALGGEKVSSSLLDGSHENLGGEPKKTFDRFANRSVKDLGWLTTFWRCHGLLVLIYSRVMLIPTTS